MFSDSKTKRIFFVIVLPCSHPLHFEASCLSPVYSSDVGGLQACGAKLLFALQEKKNTGSEPSPAPSPLITSAQ